MPNALQLLLLLALAVTTAKLAGSLATWIGQPSVFGEILLVSERFDRIEA
jgi:hypothetical protein